MPRSEPLSPPLLGVAATLAALPAAWLVLAADAVISGAAGALAGFEWYGLALSHSFTVYAVQQTSGSHAPLAWIAALLAGPLGTALLAYLGYSLAESTGASAWLRVLALEGLAFASLRVPALLLAGVVPHGRGPFDTLYVQLGEPQTGRWSLVLLALVALSGAAALVGREAVTAGRFWMRVDARDFRRRLARILVAYPAVVALAAWCVVEPWSPPAWMAAWLALTLAVIPLTVS